MEVKKALPDQPDPDVMAGAQIGEIFGAQLGSLIAGHNPFAQVLAGSALATILGNLGGVVSSYFNGEAFDGENPDGLTDSLDDVELPEFSDFFTVLRGPGNRRRVELPGRRAGRGPGPRRFRGPAVRHHHGAHRRHGLADAGLRRGDLGSRLRGSEARATVRSFDQASPCLRQAPPTICRSPSAGR
jgi:hypothetical protein